MGPFCMLMYLMITTFYLLLLSDSFSIPKQPLCHGNERSALLHFKQRFSINKSASSHPSSYPKITTWSLQGGSEDDCCSWDGVKCDPDTAHVISLDLSSSFLYGSIDSNSTLFSLAHLRYLNLADNHFNYSQIPSETANLLLLTSLNLSSSMFSGPLPASLGSLTELTSLDLSKNQLQGQIPISFSKLENIDHLDLSFNGLNGTVHADVFLNLKKLTQLHLSYNSITFLINNTKSTSLPKFTFLGLGSCNLSEFPDFLRFQEKLKILSLVKNKIHHFPRWMMMNGSRGSLGAARDWDRLPVVLPWPGLSVFDIRENMLEGSFPIPPPNIYGYLLSKNRLTGEIPPIICHRSSFYVLDMSDNNMSGTIPPCLSSFSDSLSVLNLKGNNFRGSVPRAFTKGCNLMMIDLSQNQLSGHLPRSMANCRNLKVLNLGENQLHDNFPIWFGSLPELQVLILRSNNLFGTVTTMVSSFKFPKLRIIDLSQNAFTGSLPLVFFQSWNAMKIANIQWRTYLTSNASIQVDKTMYRSNFAFSMTMTNKGVKTEYEKIINIFTALDLSSNKFNGDIPETIGTLKGLQLLNLSNNELTGGIPISLENLRQLESLDLSQNKLSGEIPLQLQQLNFLAFLNVSYNRLVGRIPKGYQFNTFQNTSYMENLALCGDPLSRKCGKLEGPPSTPATIDEDDDFEFPSGADWAFIFSGVASGLVVGLILGHHLTTRYNEWFVKKGGKMAKKWQTICLLLRCKRNMINW